jgi:hypothetical protein
LGFGLGCGIRVSGFVFWVSDFGSQGSGLTLSSRSRDLAESRLVLGVGVGVGVESSGMRAQGFRAGGDPCGQCPPRP